LTLAWALGKAIQDVQTSEFLANLIGTKLPSNWIAFIAAILSYVISFATGTSFGTMGILFPLLIPLAFRLSHGDEDILLDVSAAILGGSV